MSECGDLKKPTRTRAESPLCIESKPGGTICLTKELIHRLIAPSLALNAPAHTANALRCLWKDVSSLYPTVTGTSVIVSLPKMSMTFTATV